MTGTRSLINVLKMIANISLTIFNDRLAGTPPKQNKSIYITNEAIRLKNTKHGKGTYPREQR